MTNPLPPTVYVKWIESTNNPEDDFLMASEHPSAGAELYTLTPERKNETMTNDTCTNCGYDLGLHHYLTHQCPAGGEAPIGRKQEWMTLTYQAPDTHDETITELRSMLADCKAVRAQQAETIAARDAEIETLETSLKTIKIYVEKWNANKLGGASLQRQRWQRLGEVAERALSK